MVKRRKSIICLVLALTMVVLLTPCFAEEGAIHYYIAADGSDSNNGSFNSPFATLEKARDTARGAGGKLVYVNIRGGSYSIDETLKLTSADKNIVFRAYKDEKVSITGALTGIPASAFKKVTDTSVTDRIIDKNARAKVYVADLAELGITDYGFIARTGFGEGYPDNQTTDDNYPDSGLSAATLYFNDKEMTIARYPNNEFEYIYIDKVIDKGDFAAGRGYTFTTNDNRSKSWGKAEAPWVGGYVSREWCDGYTPAEIDADKGQISTPFVGYGVEQDRRFYVFNLIEELDREGEWYLDRDNGLLYIIPPAAMNDSSVIELATENKLLISVDGSSNITFRNLKFEKILHTPLYFKNGSGAVVDNCEFTNVNGTCVIMRNQIKSGVKNSNFHDIGASGVLMVDYNNNNRQKLISSEMFITNNRFERTSRYRKTYFPPICLWYVIGVLVDHNYISEVAHNAILYQGNEIIIEYNDISKTNLQTADSGAIYTGYDWSTRGNHIRYNYIHNLKMPKAKTNMLVVGMYYDDMVSGQNVYGNVFYDMEHVALMGGGRDNTFTDNIVLEAKGGIEYDARATQTTTDWYFKGKPNHKILSNLAKVPYKSDVWAAKYPELVNILEDDPEIPKHNIIKDNAFYKAPFIQYNMDGDKYLDFSTIEKPYEVKNTDSFADYKNKDFTVKPDSELAKALPNLLDIKFKEIGNYKAEIADGPWEDTSAKPAGSKADEVAASSIALLLNSPKAIAFGKTSTLDAAPVTINDRTVVPVRFIAESFGAKVDWDGEEQKVTIDYNGKEIILILGSTDMIVDGKTVIIDVPAQTINDRTVVPFRAIAENLGKTVFWDSKGLIVMNDADVLSSDDTQTIDDLIAKLK